MPYAHIGVNLLEQRGSTRRSSSLSARLHAVAWQHFVCVNGSPDDDVNAGVIRETIRHSQRVALLSYRMACKMGDTDFRLHGTEQIRPGSLAVAALFHDIGKASVPAIILAKPAALDEAEYAAVKCHPVLGVRLLDDVARGRSASSLLAMFKDVVLHHHERWDGTGYPDCLCGESIPLAARLVSVADAYDAIRYARAYKSSRTKSEAVEAIVNGAGSQFDPHMVQQFLCAVAPRRR
ncbi:HD-GYP domain-containing protein [Paraburkholderia sp. EG287A]